MYVSFFCIYKVRYSLHFLNLNIYVFKTPYISSNISLPPFSLFSVISVSHAIDRLAPLSSLFPNFPIFYNFSFCYILRTWLFLYSSLLTNSWFASNLLFSQLIAFLHSSHSEKFCLFLYQIGPLVFYCFYVFKFLFITSLFIII